MVKRAGKRKRVKKRAEEASPQACYASVVVAHSFSSDLIARQGLDFSGMNKYRLSLFGFAPWAAGKLFVVLVRRICAAFC